MEEHIEPLAQDTQCNIMPSSYCDSKRKKQLPFPQMLLWSSEEPVLVENHYLRLGIAHLQLKKREDKKQQY